MHKQINWICYPCGVAAASAQGLRFSLTAKYQHKVCDICGQLAPVTSPKDFGYPEFGDVDEYRQISGTKRNNRDAKNQQADFLRSQKKRGIPGWN